MKNLQSLLFLSTGLVFIILLQGCSDKDPIHQDPLTDRIVTRSIAIVCVDAYVTVGEYTEFKGTHCWAIDGGGSGGDYYRPNISYPTSDPYTPDGYPQSQSSGNGGSFNNGTNWYFSYQVLQNSKIYNPLSTLNLLEKEFLLDVIELFRNGPTDIKALYNYMTANTMQIKFEINPAQAAQGQYSTLTKKIVFQSINAINANVLVEELFHAVQHQKFYGDEMSTDYKNYEFEAKVFKDLASLFCLDDPDCIWPTAGLSGTAYPECSPEFESEYEDWMDDIVEAGYMSTPLMNKFNDICSRWGGDSGSTLPNFIPKALKHFMGHIRPPQP